jgi:esterase/lipase superfamily enzyme
MAPDPVLEPLGCEGPAQMTAFARAIAADAKSRGCDRVLVIVHGFNLTFRNAMLHGAQIATDTQWPCATLLLNWSSEGLFNRYAADIERSGYAVPNLIGLLRAMKVAGLTVNVIGHSMGARMALGAAGALCEERRDVVDQMILAAADVSVERDNDDFGHLLKRAGRCVHRTTVYASDNDLALITSESAHGGVPRAGRVPLANLQYGTGYGAVDVVDASLAPGAEAGHNYFVHSFEMLRDMMWVLAGTPAAQRAAADGTLTCSDWEGSSCAGGGGRYVLAVAPERQPDWKTRMLRRLWPLIFHVQVQ